MLTSAADAKNLDKQETIFCPFRWLQSGLPPGGDPAEPQGASTYQPLLGRRLPSHIPLSPCLAAAPTPALSPEPGGPGWLLKNPRKQHVVGSGAGPRGSPASLQPVPGDWEHAARHDSTPVDATNGKFTLRRPRQHLLPAFGVTVTTTLTVSGGPWWGGHQLPSPGASAAAPAGGWGVPGVQPPLCSQTAASVGPTVTPPRRQQIKSVRQTQDKLSKEDILFSSFYGDVTNNGV